MGEFYSFGPHYGPSDSYLAENHLENLEDAYDEGEHEDYYIGEDEEALNYVQYCHDCNAPYTINDLLSTFQDIVEKQYGYVDVHYPYIHDQFDDMYCPDCAARRYAEAHEQDHYIDVNYAYELDDETDNDDMIDEDYAAEIYMSSGEDEDYTFGYDPDDLRKHYT